MLRGARCLAECMCNAGIKRVYGIIGTSVLPFVNALYDYRGRIRYISVRHEQTATTMADAEGRVTGNPGIALVHAGAGFANSIIAVAIAYKDCSPLLLISGGVKRKLKGLDGMLELEQQKMIEPVVKASFYVNNVHRLPELFCSAYNASVSGVKGPVMLEVPVDVWEEGTEVETAFERQENVPQPQKDKIDGLVNLLANSEKPLVIAGGGIGYSDCHRQLLEFVEGNSIPVATTGNGRGSIPESHPLSLGTIGYGGGTITADYAFEQADLIICLGCSISDMTSYEYTAKPKGDVVLINLDERTDQKKVPYSLWIYGDVGRVVERIRTLKPAEEVKEKRSEWLREIGIKKDEWRQLLNISVNPSKSPISAGFLAQNLSSYLESEDYITVGAGMHRVFAYDFLSIEEPRRFFGSTNFGAMSFAFPAALGIKATMPERKVVCIAGDGEFMMTVQDLETAKRENLGVKVFVLNDNSYRVLTIKQKISGHIYGSEHANPDFVKLAESFGIEGFRVEKPEDVKILKQVFSDDAPCLVEVVIDPDDIPPMNFPATLRVS